MKKVILAFLMFIYVSTSIGVTVNLHYCMGKITSLDLSTRKADNCDKCGMAKGNNKDKGCCKDEQKFVQNTTDQKGIDVGIELAQLFGVALPVAFGDIPAIHLATVTEENPLGHSPPPHSSVAIFLRNCNFLI